MKLYRILLVAGMLLIAAVLVFGAQAQEPPEGENPLGEPPTFLRDYYDAWAASPHADVEAEAFVHWNEEGIVEADCAKCHSTPGYQDYLGSDGSEAGVVNNEAIPVGSVVNCDACHNDVASHLETVAFPSGAEVTNLSDSTRCMVCHQGRASMVQVNDAIAAAGVGEDMNVVSDQLRFINIHYYAAAASLYGSEAHGGYEFEGMSYQPRFRHVEGYDSCAECHDPHTLEIQVSECATCHEGVESSEDLRSIRMPGSLVDYDGDGDIEEGIAAEIEGLQAMTMQAIQAYTTEIIGTPIAYSSTAYPYWFIDTNANGTADEDEMNNDNRYATFSARLLQATYNYQVTLKDPGNFAHNAKYHIELLFDTIEVLNGELEQAIDLSTSARNDAGHFDATGEPFRHWDAEGEVPGSCAKCHTSGGLPQFLANGTTIAAEPSDSLACTTCHDSLPEFTLYPSPQVTFPSGAVLSFSDDPEESPAENLCLNCHQGRESTVSVNRAINSAGVGDDEVSDKLAFRNVHYFAAGASLFGGDAQGAYQYADHEYSGQFEHVRSANTCIECHDPHQLEIEVETCADCHENVESEEDVRLIRMTDEDEVELIDYDGDGNMEEPIADEIASFQEALFASLQAYALETTGVGIAYDAHAHPYFYIDTNANGLADAEEVNRDNRFVTWTPNLLRAAYNYQYSQKDPGVFAHNADYIMQAMYDSIESVGGDVASFTRPPVEEED